MSSQENELYSPPFDWEQLFWMINSPEYWMFIVAIAIVWVWKKWDDRKSKHK